MPLPYPETASLPDGKERGKKKTHQNQEQNDNKEIPKGELKSHKPISKKRLHFVILLSFHL
jgi:hypothetical protein